jgi:oxygen-independent coproporphyrinogen-3 oxidase
VNSHHLYVHVPFCRLVCAYCDFVTVAGRRDDIPRYVEALLAEMSMRPAPGKLDTVYFGGGTPSLFPASAVERLLQAAIDRWRRSPSEVTIEANPSGRETPDWAAVRAAGVNRVSLGVQSLRDDDLRTLARGHTAAEARDAYRAARRAGFESVSIDLIYGIPGQSLGGWKRGLREAIALQLDHISLYTLSLTLAPDEWAAPPRGGALRWRRRLATRQSDDVAADQYRLAEDELAAAGYRHYELSSWARPGFESRHNLAYWARRPYTGIGAGAHSYDGDAVRSWNVRDLDRYLAGVRGGDRPVDGSEQLDREARMFEAVMLGLRRVDGFSRAEFRSEYGIDPVEWRRDAAARASKTGLLEISRDHLRLTREGRLLADTVLVEYLAEPAPSAHLEAKRETGKALAAAR